MQLPIDVVPFFRAPFCWSQRDEAAQILGGSSLSHSCYECGRSWCSCFICIRTVMAMINHFVQRTSTLISCGGESGTTFPTCCALTACYAGCAFQCRQRVGIFMIVSFSNLRDVFRDRLCRPSNSCLEVSKQLSSQYTVYDSIGS